MRFLPQFVLYVHARYEYLYILYTIIIDNYYLDLYYEDDPREKVIVLDHWQNVINLYILTAARQINCIPKTTVGIPFVRNSLCPFVSHRPVTNKLILYIVVWRYFREINSRISYVFDSKVMVYTYCRIRFTKIHIISRYNTKKKWNFSLLWQSIIIIIIDRGSNLLYTYIYRVTYIIIYNIFFIAVIIIITHISIRIL